MLLTRKLGKILRGKATAPQVVLACLLGGMLGFVPGFFLPGNLGGGFLQAPGLILTLVFLVLVLNANLAIFGLVTLVAKLLSLLLLSVSFELGRLLLDGPLHGLFQKLVNAPVLAWFGLEHYATTGGLLLGVLFGIACGILLWRSLTAFRRKMAEKEQNSERYQKWANKRWVRFLTWVFLGGGHGKLTYQDLVERKGRNPIRIAGVVVVLVLVAGLWFAQSFLAGPAFRSAFQSGLERVNGATSEVATALVDLAGGEIRTGGIAVADSGRLERDTFRARELKFDLGTGDFLRKRFVIEEIVSAEASSGQPRKAPGKRIAREDEPPPPPPDDGQGKTLDDYLAEAKKWKERLAQVQHILEKLSAPGETKAETKEEKAARIAREKRDGITEVIASDLVARTPFVTVRKLLFEGVTVADLDNDQVDLHATNLSSNPALLDAPMQVSLKSRSGKLLFGFQIGAGAPADVKLELKGLSVDAFAKELKVGGQPPLKGGTMDVAFAGKLTHDAKAGFVIDMPLQVTLHGTTLSIQGIKDAALDQITIPLGVRGPLRNPRITIDDSKLADALVAAGRKEVADEVRKRAEGLLKGKIPGAGEKVQDLIQGTKTPEQVLEEARKQAEAEARKRAEDELKKKADEAVKKGIGDIFKKK